MIQNDKTYQSPIIHWLDFHPKLKNNTVIKKFRHFFNRLRTIYVNVKELFHI